MPQDIVDDQINLGKIAFVDEATAERLSRHKLVSGDIVFPRRGDIGKRALIGESEAGYLCGTGCLKISCPTKELDPAFLYLFLSQPRVVSEIESQAIGATMLNLNTEILRNVEISYPDLNTQQAIAAQLLSLQRLYRCLLHQTQLLEHTAQLIYTEWFVRLRSPIRKSGSKGNLAEALWINPKTPCEQGKLAPFVPMTALSETGMVLDGIEERAIGGGAKFQNGDTLIARITPCLENGKTGFVQFLDDANPVASGSTEFIVLRSRRVNPYWAYCLARTEHFREFAIRSMSGADGRQRVSTDTLAEYPVTIPHPDVLEEFAVAVGPMFEQVHTLTKHVAQLRQARDLLLPRLISGQLRL
jgi:type I restriction enzyme S subunit